MIKAQGYCVEHWDYGQINECDSFTCAHCQRITLVPVGSSPYDLGGGCRICDSLICSECVDVGRCLPWEETILKIERNWDLDKLTSKLVGR